MSVPSRIIATIRKNPREVVRLETEDGPRLLMNVCRQHGDRMVVVRCLGRFRPDALKALADGIREAEMALRGGSHG